LVLLETNKRKTILEGNKSAVALYMKLFLKSEEEYVPIEVYIGHLDEKCRWQW
jgi:hypothetical protein